jgi:hypothetical protein
MERPVSESYSSNKRKVDTAFQASRYASAVAFGLFLLPAGRPRLFGVSFIADIQAGGRPRRLPRPCAMRSMTTMACSICSRSSRRSASIFKMSIFKTIAQTEVTRCDVPWQAVASQLTKIASANSFQK